MAANGVSGPHGSDVTGSFGGVSQVVDLGGIGFGDILRAVNPLQYVPVVGTIYRLVTGDAAPAGARAMVGAVLGALTGGPIGLIGSLGSLGEQALHLEDHLRDAFVAPHATAVSPPAETAAAAPVAAPAKAVAAYRAAGLLGAV